MILSIVVVLASLYFYQKRWDYNALANGNNTARSLGVNVSRVRFVSLFLAALITAVSVAFLGMISFVGLLGPHIMRRVIGHDQPSQRRRKAESVHHPAAHPGDTDHPHG